MWWHTPSAPPHPRHGQWWWQRRPLRPHRARGWSPLPHPHGHVEAVRCEDCLGLVFVTEAAERAQKQTATTMAWRHRGHPVSSSPAGQHEGDDNDGVWRRPRCEGVDLAGNMRRRGGAQHTSPDGEALAPWSLMMRAQASDGKPDPGRWCDAEVMPSPVGMARSIQRQRAEEAAPGARFMVSAIMRRRAAIARWWWSTVCARRCTAGRLCLSAALNLWW